MENLFEKIMENFPNMAKKIDFQKVQEAREKETVTYKGVPIRLSSDFSKETLQARRDR